MSKIFSLDSSETGMLKQKYFLTDFFILSAEKQPIKLSWRNIEWLQYIFLFSSDYFVLLFFLLIFVLYNTVL